MNRPSFMQTRWSCLLAALLLALPKSGRALDRTWIECYFVPRSQVVDRATTQSNARYWDEGERKANLVSANDGHEIAPGENTTLLIRAYHSPLLALGDGNTRFLKATVEYRRPLQGLLNASDLTHGIVTQKLTFGSPQLVYTGVSYTDSRVFDGAYLRMTKHRALLSVALAPGLDADAKGALSSAGLDRFSCSPTFAPLEALGVWQGKVGTGVGSFNPFYREPDPDRMRETHGTKGEQK